MKIQHNLVTSRIKSDMHGSQATIPKNTFTSNRNTEQGHGHTNWMKMLTMLMSWETSLDDWNMKSDQTDQRKDNISGDTKYI